MWLNLESADDDSWGTDHTPTQTSVPVIEDKKYSFYGGTIDVWFNHERHEYFRLDENGLKVIVPGVTSALAIVSKPFLKNWAVKQAILSLQASILTVAGILRSDLSSEEVIEAFEAARHAHEGTLATAGNIGTVAHDALEVAIIAAIGRGDGILKECPQVDPNHRIQPNAEQLRQAQNAATEAYKWAIAHNVRFLQTERKIYSRLYDFSGTLDGIAIVDSCTDPLCKGCRGRVFKDERCVIDFKTSNQISTDYAWQVSSYEFAYLEEFPEEILKGRWILRIGKEAGDFEAWYLGVDSFESDLDAFLAALELYKQKKAIEDRRSKESREFNAVVREAGKAKTEAANVGRDALYKELRAQKVPVEEAKKLSREAFPVKAVKPRAQKKATQEDADDFDKIVPIKVVERKPVSVAEQKEPVSKPLQLSTSVDGAVVSGKMTITSTGPAPKVGTLTVNQSRRQRGLPDLEGFEPSVPEPGEVAEVENQPSVIEIATETVVPVENQSEQTVRLADPVADVSAQVVAEQEAQLPATPTGTVMLPGASRPLPVIQRRSRPSQT